MKTEVGKRGTAENYETLVALRYGVGCGIWLGCLYLALRLDADGGVCRNGHRLRHWWSDDCHYQSELRLYYSRVAADR